MRNTNLINKINLLKNILEKHQNHNKNLGKLIPNLVPFIHTKSKSIYLKFLHIFYILSK